MRSALLSLSLSLVDTALESNSIARVLPLCAQYTYTYARARAHARPAARNVFIFSNLCSTIPLKRAARRAPGEWFAFSHFFFHLPPTLSRNKTKARGAGGERGLYLASGKLLIAVFDDEASRYTRGPRTRARILFRAVSVPCGQQGSRQYLCRRNCPPTSKGVSKRINFTRRREKGVNI